MDYIKVNIEADMKKEAQRLFEDMGLNLSQGVKLLLKQCINRGRIPFEIRGKQPNAETIAAMRELEQGGGERFDNADDLFLSWEK